MKKINYKEPAFLKDIHNNQILNYKKTKSLSLQKRISLFIKEARCNLERLGLHSVELVHK